MPRKALLCCEDLSKSFGAAPLFEGLTFTLHDRDHVGLVGPNGAGKSTFLKILGGLEKADKGTCTHPKSLRIGYVPQNPVFPPGKSVEDVITAALALDTRLDDRDRHRQASVALGKAGFTDPDISTDVLSGGWRARLAIARELARTPDLLLLDEPTNHLDIESILWLESLLRGVAGAFVVVSHDRYFLDRNVDYLLSFENGIMGTRFPTPFETFRQLNAGETLPDRSTLSQQPKPISAQRPRTHKLTWKERQELGSIEERIGVLEDQVRTLETTINASGNEYERLHQLANELEQLNHGLAVAEERWLELSEIEDAGT